MVTGKIMKIKLYMITFKNSKSNLNNPPRLREVFFVFVCFLISNGKVEQLTVTIRMITIIAYYEMWKINKINKKLKAMYENQPKIQAN